MNWQLTSQKTLRKVETCLKRNSPTILSCIGAIGVVATAALAVKATPKALVLIEEANEAKSRENEEKMTRMETIAVCWRCYVPATVTGIATIGCIFGANVLNKRQQASLMSAYAFINRSFKEYQNAVKEVFGEEGHDRVMQQILVENPDPPGIYGNLTGESFDFGETSDEKRLFYDAFSKRYFDATFADVLLAELHTNRNFAINGGEIPLSSFYEFLGLETPEELKDLCWFMSDYYYFIDFTHSRHLIDDGPGHDPVECWVIEMPFPPTLEPPEDH